MKLNIGCGRDYREGWINIDISESIKVDRLIDIRTEKLPWEGTVIDEIYISGVLEQIGSNVELLFAMNECYRVLKQGGIMTVVVPNARFAIAHQDPMDIRKFTRETFPYFIKGMRHYEEYGSVYGFKGWTSFDIEENERHIFVIKMRK